MSDTPGISNIMGGPGGPGPTLPPLSRGEAYVALETFRASPDFTAKLRAGDKDAQAQFQHAWSAANDIGITSGSAIAEGPSDDPVERQHRVEALTEINKSMPLALEQIHDRAPITRELRNRARQNVEKWKADPAFMQKVAQGQEPEASAYQSARLLTDFPILPDQAQNG